MNARDFVCAGVIAWCVQPVLRAQHEDRTSELQRTQRAMQQSRSEVDRLIEMRLRHDLGLSPAKEADAADRTFRPGGPVTSESMERLNVELDNENNTANALREKYAKLRAAVEALRVEADQRLREQAESPAFVTVPVAGRAPNPAAGGGDRRAAPVATPPPAPIAEPAAAAEIGAVDPVAIDPTLDPLRAQIHGSTDHRRVAQALFRAGQALLDRAAAAREQNQAAVARQLDDRGKERLKRALDELAPLLAEKEPSLDALFHQGKILELLFRYSERNENLTPAANARDWQRREQEVRDPFLKITARDVRKTGERGETEILGSWGKAAQTALEHFRWMNLHAGYDATAVIDALTWPGEKDL